MNIPTPAKKTRKSPLNKASHISQVCFSKPLTLDFFTFSQVVQAEGEG